MTIAVSIQDVTKHYAGGKRSPAKHALKGVSFDIPQGSFFGLLGPNGAGKSTLINIMAGLVVKSSGSVSIQGYDIDKQRRQASMSIGVVPQELVVDTFFTVRQALDIHAGYYAVPKANRRTQEIIDALGLGEQADINSRRLSGGMKRRLLIGKALVHQPPVLVLDEPTAGVDVELREQLWTYVRELNKNGTTVLLTTHYLEEAQELCDRIAIINHGDLVALDSKDALMGRMDSKEVQFQLGSALSKVPDALADFTTSLSDDGHRLCIRYQPSATQMGALLSAVQESGAHITDMVTQEPELEDVFRQLTAREAA